LLVAFVARTLDFFHIHQPPFLFGVVFLGICLCFMRMCPPSPCLKDAVQGNETLAITFFYSPSPLVRLAFSISILTLSSVSPSGIPFSPATCSRFSPRNICRLPSEPFSFQISSVFLANPLNGSLGGRSAAHSLLPTFVFFLLYFFFSPPKRRKFFPFSYLGFFPGNHVSAFFMRPVKPRLLTFPRSTPNAFRWIADHLCLLIDSPLLAPPACLSPCGWAGSFSRNLAIVLIFLLFFTMFPFLLLELI